MSIIRPPGRSILRATLWPYVCVCVCVVQVAASSSFSADRRAVDEQGRVGGLRETKQNAADGLTEGVRGQQQRAQKVEKHASRSNISFALDLIAAANKGERARTLVTNRLTTSFFGSNKAILCD